MAEHGENNFGLKFLSVESIYKWKPVIYEENLNEISCEFEPHAKNEFNFNNFIIRLVKSYQAAETGDIDAALDLLNQLDDAGKEFDHQADRGFFEGIQKAYYHMVYASKVFLLAETERHQEALVLVEKIFPIDDMDKFNKAAIYAMKTAVFALYSNEDSQKAFASIDKALKLDPDNPHWNFLKALCIRKIRKMTNPFDVPTFQEQALFKKAFDSDNQNVVFKLHLADVYREISPHAFKRQDNCSHFLPKDSSLTTNLRNNIEEKIKLAVEYYKQAAEEYPDSSYVMFKAAEGLAELSPKQNHIQLARNLTKDGLKQNPESVRGNLIMAHFCEAYDKNLKNATKHLKKCQAKKIFDAEVKMIKFLYDTKRDEFDVIEALETLLEKYQEKKRHAILYSHIVSYYISVNFDLVKACDAAMKYFSLNCESTAMQVHRCLFVKYPDPFSLIDVLNDEVKLAMNNNCTLPEVRAKCEKYIQAINFQNIKVIQGPPQNLRQQLLQGKPLTVNSKFVQLPRKFNNFDKGGNRRDTNGGRGDFRNRRNQPMNNRSNTLNNHPSTSNNRMSTSNNHPSTSNNPRTPNRQNTNKRPNNQQSKNPPTDFENMPSLMDNIVNKPAQQPQKNPPEPHKSPEPIENRPEPRSEERESDPKDTKNEDRPEVAVQMAEKQKENYDSDESIESKINRWKLSAKNTQVEEFRSNLDSDSSQRGQKDRGEHSKGHYRPKSYSSNESDRRDDHDRRNHGGYSDSDSDGYSKSSRYRKGFHKKDRHEREYSPRERRNRYRDESGSPKRRRHGRKDSVSRSPSYDRHSRYYSPKKESRYRNSVCRSPSYDRHSRRPSPKKEKLSHRDSVHRSPFYDKSSRRHSPRKEKSRHREYRSPSYDRRNRYSSKKEKSSHRDSVHRSPSSDRSDHGDSAYRSPSYDRRSRQRSSKKEKSSRRDRNNSPDRYSIRSHKVDEIDQRRDSEYKSKSSKRYDRDTTSYEKKSRRRSVSREKYEDYRSKKESRSKKDFRHEENIRKNRRDGNSSQESGSE